MCRKPRKSNVSGLPSPRRARSLAAKRPNSIKRVFSGCNVSANFSNRSRKSARKRRASPSYSKPATMSSAKRTYLWIDATLCEDPPGRPHRLSGRDNRRRSQQRRNARGAGHGDRRLRSRAILDRVPALTYAPWVARCEANHLRRSCRYQGGGGESAEIHMAAVSSALPEKRIGARWERPAADGSRDDHYRLRTGYEQNRQRPVARCR